MLAGIVPGLISMLIVPWIASKVNPPEIKHTPEAAEFARRKLIEMGALSRNEKILLTVFVITCGLWMTTDWHHMDVAVSALIGAVVLLILGVLSWDDVIKEETAWDIFIWYGGLLQLAKNLNDTGVTTEFAKGIAASMSGTMRLRASLHTCCRCIRHSWQCYS
jgi:DASS family divalent anion:Na+ symporter